jgi:predicted secreted hydrolase
MPAPLHRRGFLKTGLAGALGACGLAAHQGAAALAPAALRFPRDAGAHNDFATEWWYITGYANLAGQAAALGFQITFFRSRVANTQKMQSRLAAKQLLFAHAAVTDVAGKKLWHDQRIARWSAAAPDTNPLDRAHASSTHMAVTLTDWSLLSDLQDKPASLPGSVPGQIRATVAATDFSMALQFSPTQPLLLQGKEGLSRKGPEEKQASYYYSLPQLQVQGDIVLRGKRHALQAGSAAWLDHEWSQEVLHPLAVGWDWIGINLLDGSALTAFQLRDKDGRAMWDGGSFRSGSGVRYVFSRGEVLFRPVRYWRSPLSKASYPVEWIVRTPADYYTVAAVIDNQELDSRQSTGAIYWEGLSEVHDSNGKLVGRGYLEMTGYAAALKM